MNTLPDPTTAQNLLYGQIHMQVFLQKCAAAGFTPQTDEQVFQMVETASMLRQMQEQQTVKSAYSQDNFFSALYDNVATAATQQGLLKQANTPADFAAEKLAANLMQSPDLYNAVLAVKQAEAQHIATTLPSR